MADFKRQGGSLTGREERYDGFEGEPKSVGSALAGATGTHGHHSTTTAGPHSSNLANKADPRVDSDRDGSRNMGAAQPGYDSRSGGTGTSMGTGYDGTTGSGYGDRSSGTGLAGSGTHHRNDPYSTSSTTSGPHSSSLGNKADPRVDSDHSRTTGTGLTGTSSRHHNDPYSSSTTTSGPHSSNLENKVDPRVDSDNSRLSGGHHSSTTDPSFAGAGVGKTGAGNYYDGATTTGPDETTTHSKPSLLSRLNPMKDSDGDGKKGFMK